MSYNPVFDPTLPSEHPLILSAELREALNRLGIPCDNAAPNIVAHPPAAAVAEVRPSAFAVLVPQDAAAVLGN